MKHVKTNCREFHRYKIILDYHTETGFIRLQRNCFSFDNIKRLRCVCKNPNDYNIYFADIPYNFQILALKREEYTRKNFKILSQFISDLENA